MTNKEEIKKALKKGGKTIQQIVDLTNIPRESIRRDLGELQQKGLVEKVIDNQQFIFKLVN